MELPAFVDTVPDYEVRDGYMHITMGGLELVMPVAIFMLGCQIGTAAVVEWQQKRHVADIVPFEPQTKFERIYKGKPL